MQDDPLAIHFTKRRAAAHNHFVCLQTIWKPEFEVNRPGAEPLGTIFRVAKIVENGFVKCALGGYISHQAAVHEMYLCQKPHYRKGVGLALVED